MHNRVFSQFRSLARGYLFPRRHTALLVALASTFAVRPLIGNVGMAPLIFSIALLVLMLVALYTVQVDELIGEREVLVALRRRWSIAGWTLAAGAGAERIGMMVAPSRQLNLLGNICWLLFFGFVTWNELRAVLRQREVTGETISMSISVYLLMGLTWGLLYILIYQLHPGAISLGTSSPLINPANTDEMFSALPVLIYFSFITLSTVGYGEVTPVSLQARYAAMAEGITGQFYLAILVARLVGLHMLRYVARRAEHDTSESGHKESAPQK